jgi:hypothetical protein
MDFAVLLKEVIASDLITGNISGLKQLEMTKKSGRDHVFCRYTLSPV